MKNSILHYTITVLFLVNFAGCSSEPAEPKFSQALKEKAMKLIDSASVLTSGSENGINFNDYGDAVNKFNSDLDLLLTFWPDGYKPLVVDSLQNAKESWLKTREMWSNKISRNAESYDQDSRISYQNAPELWKAALVVKDGGYPYYSSIGSTLGVGGLYFQIAKPTLLEVVK
jgi:hypothetical protein